VLEAVFVLLEFSSPSRTIFIGSHSLPPSLVRRIGPSHLFHGFDTLGSHLREDGSLDYDGGFVRLQVHLNFNIDIHQQQVSCVMEAMLYGPGVESSSETVTFIGTHPDGFSVVIKYASEGSLPEEANLWTLLPMPGLIYSRSPTCTKSNG
jgi:hypothetical protein